MSRLEQGCVQVYTGNGKGKTTAALGLALRALGAGLQVLFVQFMKDYPYGELRMLDPLRPQLTLWRYGNDAFVLEKRPPDDQEIAAYEQAVQEVMNAISSGEWDLVVLDEACVAAHFGALTEEDLLAFTRARPGHTELVFTGRYCPDALLDRADLVTEMVERRHYYQRGILSRAGIDA